MKFSDEKLMAYTDGELGAEERTAVEAAMSSEPEITQRIERFRKQRDSLRRAFDDVLNEPVPERLINTARTAPMADAKVIGFDQARTARTAPEPRRWAWSQWTAMAASLLVGLIVGQTMLRSDDAPLLAARDGRLIAGGDLAAALTSRPSGEAAPIAIGFTYRAKSGEYCRTFTLARDQALAGIACREDAAWKVRALSQSDSAANAGDEYRMAGAALPPLLLQAVESQISGEPLDASSEAAAQRRGWQE